MLPKDDTKWPDGFIRTDSARRVVIHQPGELDSLSALGFIDGAPRGEPVGEITGRNPHRVFEWPAPSAETQRVLWKRYRRGGAAGQMLGDRYWSTNRFIEELRVTAEATACGLPVARVIAVAFENRGAGATRVEALVSMIDGSRSLAGVLASPGLSPTVRHRVIERTARTLREFHECGFIHGDLNIRNILVRDAESAEPSVHLVDLDPPTGRLRNDLGPRGNLLRLARSVAKFDHHVGVGIGATDLYRFARTYFVGDRASVRALALRYVKASAWWRLRRGLQPWQPAATEGSVDGR